MEVEVLMKKGKRGAAAYIQAECSRCSSNPENLHNLLDCLLDPLKNIDDWETIDWCRWLMAGGCTPDEFTATVRRYDNATTCGLVWTANFVAYRCRTCGISPCMSLCAECFQRGNHKGHDFNMFRSQAGGACDCGDTNVMKESGFCYLHGPHARGEGHEHEAHGEQAAPPDLLCVAYAMMPRLILRLLQYMRQNSVTLNGFLGAVQAADKFITMLHDMSSMGAAMRHVMTVAFTNPQVYKSLTEVTESRMSPEYFDFMTNTRKAYEDALTTLPNPDPPEDYKDIQSLQKILQHRSFLEEMVFWTSKFEFPQKIVCLLLNLLPDSDYKEAFTKAFVLHYSRISQLLVRSADPDMVSNRVVHVSVQLFSNEKLALQMAEQMNLLHVMVISLQYMMSNITVPSTLLRNKDKNIHRVVDCGHNVMKDHCYWPLVSDLNNILSHRRVAFKFLGDDRLLQMWFSFLSLFQGMNANHREMNQHIEFEPTTYYAAFSAELEASASPMWALVSHLKDASTAYITKNLLRHCRQQLGKWLEAINFKLFQNDILEVSFHLPLHRYFAVFLHQAVKNQRVPLAELLPPPDELEAMIIHPLRVQTAFYEIISGLWVRNGLQIKGQAMTYIQCHFCNSMVDADLYLLQVAMMNLPFNHFISTVIDKFHISDSLSISSSTSNPYLEADQEMLMMENCLIFLATLTSVRTNIGMSDADLVTLEMITLLCMSDKTHSQLMELMPERCGNSSQSKDFEAVLAKVADYRAPNFESSGNMLQGMYVPRAFVWETVYDPIYILLRAVHRREFQTSLDRFTEYAKQAGKFKGSGSPWPPFRIPAPAAEPYTDPRNILLCKEIHSILFVIFYKAVHTTQLSDQVVALAIYLLEMALSICDESPGNQIVQPEMGSGHYDMDFSTFYSTNFLFANLLTEIDNVVATASQLSDSSEDLSVDEMEVEAFATSDYDMLESYVISDYHMRDAGAASGTLAIMPSQSDAATNTEHHTPMSEIQRQRVHNLQLVVSALKPVTAIAKRETVERAASGSGFVPRIEMVVNESLISLLLKLHSKLSSTPDSYVPFWEKPEALEVIENAKAGLNTEVDFKFTLSRDDSRVQRCQFSYLKLLKLVNGEDSRIGDGPFFVGKVLDIIGAKDPSCREKIISMRERLWPRMKDEEAERAREEKEKEERRRRARERQSKLMEEFAKKQQQFMAKNMTEEFSEDMSCDNSMNSSDIGNDGSGNSNVFKPIEYDCVICNQTSASTQDNPVGLVILLQATSVLGHRRKKSSQDPVLPTNEDERLDLKFQSEDCLMSHNDKRLTEYKQHFDDSSWLMSISGGWEGGVHVQTCGHHLHMECLKGYLSALKSQQRQHNVSIDRGEYSCPLCRQLANSFLPLSPEFGIRQCALVRDRKKGQIPLTPEATVPEIPPSPESNVALEVVKLLREYPFPTVHCKLMDAMSKTMEEMTNSTVLRFRQVGSSKNTKSILLFVNGIARTNLELEITQRGGNLVSVPSDPQPSTSAASNVSTSSASKRSCIVPLLHVLGVHYKILSTEPCSPKIWERILGIRFLPDTSLMPMDPEVPMLLRDPCTTLIHLIMQLPIHVDLAYYSSMVQGIYNLVYIQILCQLSLRLSEKERDEWKAKTALGASDDINQMFYLLGTVIRYLEKSPLFLPDSDFGDMDSQFTKTRSPSLAENSEEELELEIQDLLLPYIRIAALLRHHIYEQELPYISSSREEFCALAQFLCLGGSQITENAEPSFPSRFFQYAQDNMKAHNFLQWISPTPLTAIWTWCEDLCNFIGRAQVSALSLISSHNMVWSAPKLMELPIPYDIIFQYYHRKQCPNCNLVPKDPNVCLVCGAMVCMRDSCCKQPSTGMCEAIQHSIDCGAGTVMYLSVNSSTIVVVRGRRACIWGSVYLDSFGEEDRELKRGKPLFLSKERYTLLQQQWMSHRFDHTNRKWIWHRDNL